MTYRLVVDDASVRTAWRLPKGTVQPPILGASATTSCRLSSNCNLGEEVDSRPLFRFPGSFLNPTSVNRPAFVGTAVIHCDPAILLPKHALQLGEKLLDVGACRITALRYFLKPMVGEVLAETRRPSRDGVSVTQEQGHTCRERIWEASYPCLTTFLAWSARYSSPLVSTPGLTALTVVLVRLCSDHWR